MVKAASNEEVMWAVLYISLRLVDREVASWWGAIALCPNTQDCFSPI